MASPYDILPVPTSTEVPRHRKVAALPPTAANVRNTLRSSPAGLMLRDDSQQTNPTVLSNTHKPGPQSPIADKPVLDQPVPDKEPALNDDLLQQLSTAVLVVDGQLRIRTLNQAAEVLLQISGQRCIGELASSVLVASPSTFATFANPIEQALQSGSSITLRATMLRLPTGVDIAVDYTVTPLVDGVGRLADRSASGNSTSSKSTSSKSTSGKSTSGKSISGRAPNGNVPTGNGAIIEISPLESALHIRREEAQASVQESARLLLRGLAHEIKNPLGGVRGAAQLLERELPTPQLREYTKIIIDEADRLRDLVDRLLAPRPRLRNQPTNIHRILERVTQLIQVETPDVRIERDYDPSLPALHADESQLIQAVLNIMRNAQQALMEHGPKDGGIAKITLRSRIVRQTTIGARRHRLAARVDIVDNGPGIPDAIADKLFFPMISGRANGTGLGLSIAQAIIAQHQGALECTSRPGQTRFSITLPLEQTDER